MDKKIYVISRLTAENVNTKFVELDVRDCVIGYIEGTEDDARKVCESMLENEQGKVYNIEEDNEHIYYPQYHYWDLPKLN